MINILQNDNSFLLIGNALAKGTNYLCNRYESNKDNTCSRDDHNGHILR